MYRYFDIDDLGNSTMLRGGELEEFDSFSPEWEAYQQRWKELVQGGMNKKDAKKQAQKELNYKPAADIWNKAKDLFKSDGESDPAVEGGSSNDAGAKTPPLTPPATAGVGSGLTGSISLGGIQVPTIALLGVAGVAAWWFMKKR